MLYVIYVGKNDMEIMFCRKPNDYTVRVQMFYYAICLTSKPAEISEVRNVVIMFDNFI